MKIKLNKRLLQIGIGCLIVAAILIGYSFNQMKKAAQPEPTESIAYFSIALYRGMIIKESDIVMKATPISMIPADAIRSKGQLMDRELVVDVSQDEFALMNKTTVRGEIREDIEKMWEIGIEVKEISDFLGSQIKVDEYYALMFADPVTNEKHIINRVKVTALVDSSGKVLHPGAEGVPKTVIMAVETQEEIKEIADYKMRGLFELVRPPRDWQLMRQSEEMELEQEIGN